MGEEASKFLEFAAGLTDEQLGAVVRGCLAPAPATGIPYASKGWVTDAIELIRVQGVGINPNSKEVRAMLAAPGWGGSKALSEVHLNKALTMAINRAKSDGRDVVALLCSILKRETAEGILGGAPAATTGGPPRDACNTTTGEGRGPYVPSMEAKIKALLGHASTCRERAGKHDCPRDLVTELFQEAVRYEAEAARIGPEEEHD